MLLLKMCLKIILNQWKDRKENIRVIHIISPYLPSLSLLITFVFKVTFGQVNICHSLIFLVADK